ncbi:DUF1178 family protein [Erythrobacter sp. THAF29]|uniref:DUF1178 family protein n=1 Tax=Erythrobacter sp. THAF29 TaxID=2587851 RepID=UPI0012692E5C|nr:DUF1178 family protein [Erythrobacter sp. THAF29]QFT77955.1 hypothetical protein FIU90_10450 [Erythrobacter sp. THAF29]
MIVFDLHCEQGHRFEGWFGSSSDYEDQKARGLISCPECGTAAVDKAPMAPAVPAKGNTLSERPAIKDDARPVSNTPMPAEVQQAMQALAKAQKKALKDSTWVGDKFAEQSREMHYGERDEAPIHGQATLEEAKSLVDEGVPVAPLPFPVAPPEELN